MDASFTLRRNEVLRLALIALFFAWLIFSISSFFVVNKPLDTGFGQNIIAALGALALSPAAISRTLLDMGATVWIGFVALGTGITLWDVLVDERSDDLATLVFAAGLGFGALGLLTLALGLLGLITRPIFLAILGLLTVATGPGAIGLLKNFRWQRPPRSAALFLLVALGMTLALALLPPTSWDGLFYHLKAPKLYLQSGFIRPGIDIPHLNFPSLFEMLFLLAMELRGDVAAKLIHMLYMLLLGGIVYLLATRSLRVRNGWLSLVFLYSTPLIVVVGAWAYNDLALSYYSLAALYTFQRWDETQNERWLLLAGVLSGFMMGLKYTSVVIVIFLVTMIIWRQRRDLGHTIRPLLYFVLPAVALVAPWLIKNWLFTGNPVYPFLFGGQFWDDFRAAKYSGAGSGIGLDLQALLRLPYDMTLGYADASQEATIGPFYLIFLPLILIYSLTSVREKAPPAFSFLLVYSLISFAFWTAGVISSAGLWQARLLLPGIVALCPVLAWIMEDLARFDHPSFSLRRFLRLVSVFVVALLLLAQANSWFQINPLAYLSGSETSTDYLRRRLGAHYQAMEGINSELAADAIVVFLWEPRSYYCDLDCRPDSILDSFEHLVFMYGDAGSIVENWHDENVTHILINEVGLDFIVEHAVDPVSAEELAILQILREKYLSPVKAWNNTYTLYRVK